jgi:DNA-directed RNA polymerase subunit M/transcription elongation factor TFIIS
MGNSKSRVRKEIPQIKSNKNPVAINTIEVKSKESCPDCGNKGREFNVVSRDGTTYTKMCYCQSCHNHWKL